MKIIRDIVKESILSLVIIAVILHIVFLLQLCIQFLFILVNKYIYLPGWIFFILTVLFPQLGGYFAAGFVVAYKWNYRAFIYVTFSIIILLVAAYQVNVNSIFFPHWCTIWSRTINLSMMIFGWVMYVAIIYAHHWKKRHDINWLR